MSDLLKQLNLLYVEDDEEVRTLLERALARKVKKLYVGVDGEEGLALYKEHKPDLILTDIRMPKMDGITMSKKIKELTPNIPIIVLSAHSETNYLIEAIESGIGGYLLKPLDKEKLYTTLEEHAKIAFYEKEKSDHERLLQEVINLQPSIIFSNDETKKALFTNKLFIDYFTLENTSQHSEGMDVYEHLKKFNNVIMEDNDKDVFWLDYIFTHPNKCFKISVNSESGQNNFYVNTKVVNSAHNDKVVIVISLVEL